MAVETPRRGVEVHAIAGEKLETHQQVDIKCLHVAGLAESHCRSAVIVASETRS
jgi:hypothetical protein